ncbi:MAG: hypothetical protein ABSH48_10965 [Verrucomicrobiota bacterium]
MSIHPRESGVALRFPPQSMTLRATATLLTIPSPACGAPAERSGDGAFVRARQPRAIERLARVQAAAPRPCVK